MIAQLRATSAVLRHRFQELLLRLRADPQQPARQWARQRWRPLTAVALMVAAVWVANAWLLTCGFHGCPSPAEIRAFRPPEGGRILDRGGANLGRLTSIRRANVTLASVPYFVREAFIATEDRRFHEHRGLDLRSVARAAVRNAASLGVREGFSTITMQVARNAFVANRFHQRSVRRKLMELRLAGLIERSLDKNQILELYLNVIYLGGGAHGVEAASQDLFGKSVSQLTLAEGAMLAALPKGPSAYTPRRNEARARARRNLVLGLMAREGYISSERAAEAASQPLRLAERAPRSTSPDESFALDAVRDLVDSVLAARGLDQGDVTVHTTIDRMAQRAAVSAVRRRAELVQRDSRRWYGRRADDEVQGAMVALDPATGDVLALVGGSTYQRGGFNRALAARRQPGSAFKPFVYAAGLAAGLTPVSMVDDQPVEVYDGGKIWTPANYDNSYQGRVTLRRALMTSSNAAAVRVSRAVGEQRVITTARANGIGSPLTPVPAIALGAVEVTPVELTAAYAPFANGGYRVRPRLVRRIEAQDGTILWQQEIERTPVMSPQDAYQITSMLRSVIDHGTGRIVRDLGITGPVAGKTGTTNNRTDVWFVGYTPTVVAGFWFGYDTPKPLGGNAAGGRLAAPAWADFYRVGWKERGSEAAWEPPSGMVMRVIDAETGELAGEWCPITQREWFKPGTEPVAYCRAHEGFYPEDTWVTDVGSRISRVLKRVFRF